MGDERTQAEHRGDPGPGGPAAGRDDPGDDQAGRHRDATDTAGDPIAADGDVRPEAREIPGEQAILWAGDVDADDKNDRTSGGASSWDRQVVYRLVRRYSQDLCQLQDQVATSSKLFLLEAFCGSDSQLTKQCNRSQAPAARFGLSQGDLESTDGRREFLRMLVAHQPEHVWMSPLCRAWCQWSEFNSQRSLEAFDRVNAQRLRSLQQVALCITVFRFQVFHKRHFHLEQPKESLMLKLACLRELRSQTMAASFDLCRLGGPTDPESGKPFGKGTTVLTTCAPLNNSFHGKTCPGNHEHQAIEGNVKTDQRWINRSKHSEDYTAKFAQFVVRSPTQANSSIVRVNSISAPRSRLRNRCFRKISGATTQAIPTDQLQHVA